ncbi:holo-ACP synthase [Janibacter massiliensis]|uniref:holo-ACP synthase n=1 Tax=Janibacter massiliensis TaxID=2058291 RepID=UPI000D0F8D23|nr:holo-ACP synthase [Janibacter massiliensis]
MCATEVGVDMVSISQMASMLEASGQTYRDLCWSPAEQAYCGDSAARYATRWAAKEAAMKALGHGIGEVDPLDIEVLAHEGQRPLLRLSGTAGAFAQQAGVSLSLSISHEGDLATAFVIATRCCTNHASEDL